MGTLREYLELVVTFALGVTSVDSQETFDLMRGTIIRIIKRYCIDRIHYSAIVLGSGIPTTSFDFASNIPDQDELIRKVIRLRKRDGRPDLEQALEEAKRIFELREVRPNARRILVVIMDDATVSSREELSKVVHALVKNSVFIVVVGIGSSVNATDLLIITREEQHILIVKTNKVDDELAEEIMRVIEPRVVRKLVFSFFFYFLKRLISFTRQRADVFLRPRFKKYDLLISFLVGKFKKISAFPVYTICFPELFTMNSV